MWTIAMVFTTIGSGINILLSLRRPSIGISAIVAQLLSYPVGKAWEKFMPKWELRVFGRTIHLNPAPFNIKEHALIVVHLASLKYHNNVRWQRTSVSAARMRLTFSLLRKSFTDRTLGACLL